MRGLRVRDRPRNRRGRYHAIHGGRRRRPLHQPHDRPRPDARRGRARDRPGALGVLSRRLGNGTAAYRVAHGLRHSPIRYPALVRRRDRGSALADKPARHQGRRRRRNHARARRRHQRHRRRAARPWSPRHHHARHPAERLAGDSGSREMNPARAIAAIALRFTACSALAQRSTGGEHSYPKGPVRVILPFPAGGGVDAAGRILAQKLTEGFGKPFLIANRGGANGNIGTEAAAKSPNDGGTLLFTGAGFVTNPSLYRSVPYDPVRDFEPVSLMALGPNVLVVHPSLPVKSVRELIALAKTQPGRIGFAGSGSGSTPHLAGELFNAMAGVPMVHIPYRGSGPAMIGLLAGDAPVMFLPAINAGGHVAAGRLRANWVTNRERLAGVADPPTRAETGPPGRGSNQGDGPLAPARTQAPG